MNEILFDVTIGDIDDDTNSLFLHGVDRETIGYLLEVVARQENMSILIVRV